MIINLYPDNCKDYLFFHNWIKGRELAIINPQEYTDYIHQGLNATHRNRFNYSVKNGYSSRQFNWNFRNEHLQDIYNINISSRERQGRPMTEAYFNYPLLQSTDTECTEHRKIFIACTKNEKIYAYCELYLIGEMSEISTILGHKNYLKDGIMINLQVAIVEISRSNNIKALVYYEMDSGTEGLKYWKRASGYKPIKLTEHLIP